MVKVGLFVRLHAKPGKENELASLLSGGLSVVQEEAGTPLWFAVRFDASRSRSSTRSTTRRGARRTSRDGSPPR